MFNRNSSQKWSQSGASRDGTIRNFGDQHPSTYSKYDSTDRKATRSRYGLLESHSNSNGSGYGSGYGGYYSKKPEHNRRDGFRQPTTELKKSSIANNVVVTKCKSDKGIFPSPRMRLTDSDVDSTGTKKLKQSIQESCTWHGNTRLPAMYYSSPYYKEENKSHSGRLDLARKRITDRIPVYRRVNATKPKPERSFDIQDRPVNRELRESEDCTDKLNVSEANKTDMKAVSNEYCSGEKDSETESSEELDETDTEEESYETDSDSESIERGEQTDPSKLNLETKKAVRGSSEHVDNPNGQKPKCFENKCDKGLYNEAISQKNSEAERYAIGRRGSYDEINLDSKKLTTGTKWKPRRTRSLGKGDKRPTKANQNYSRSLHGLDTLQIDSTRFEGRRRFEDYGRSSSSNDSCSSRGYSNRFGPKRMIRKHGSCSECLQKSKHKSDSSTLPPKPPNSSLHKNKENDTNYARLSVKRNKLRYSSSFEQVQEFLCSEERKQVKELDIYNQSLNPVTSRSSSHGCIYQIRDDEGRLPLCSHESCFRLSPEVNTKINLITFNKNAENTKNNACKKGSHHNNVKWNSWSSLFDGENADSNISQSCLEHSGRSVSPSIARIQRKLFVTSSCGNIKDTPSVSTVNWNLQNINQKVGSNEVDRRDSQVSVLVTSPSLKSKTLDDESDCSESDESDCSECEEWNDFSSDECELETLGNQDENESNFHVRSSSFENCYQTETLLPALTSLKYPMALKSSSTSSMQTSTMESVIGLDQLKSVSVGNLKMAGVPNSIPFNLQKQRDQYPWNLKHELNVSQNENLPDKFPDETFRSFSKDSVSEHSSSGDEIGRNTSFTQYALESYKISSNESSGESESSDSNDSENMETFSLTLPAKYLESKQLNRDTSRSDDGQCNVEITTGESLASTDSDEDSDESDEEFEFMKYGVIQKPVSEHPIEGIHQNSLASPDSSVRDTVSFHEKDIPEHNLFFQGSKDEDQTDRFPNFLKNEREKEAAAADSEMTEQNETIQILKETEEEESDDSTDEEDTDSSSTNKRNEDTKTGVTKSIEPDDGKRTATESESETTSESSDSETENSELSNEKLTAGNVVSAKSDTQADRSNRSTIKAADDDDDECKDARRMQSQDGDENFISKYRSKSEVVDTTGSETDGSTSSSSSSSSESEGQQHEKKFSLLEEKNEISTNAQDVRGIFSKIKSDNCEKGQKISDDRCNVRQSSSVVNPTEASVNEQDTRVDKAYAASRLINRPGSLKFRSSKAPSIQKVSQMFDRTPSSTELNVRSPTKLPVPKIKTSPQSNIATLSSEFFNPAAAATKKMTELFETDRNEQLESNEKCSMTRTLKTKFNSSTACLKDSALPLLEQRNSCRTPPMASFVTKATTPPRVFENEKNDPIFRRKSENQVDDEKPLSIPPLGNQGSILIRRRRKPTPKANEDDYSNQNPFSDVKERYASEQVDGERSFHNATHRQGYARRPPVETATTADGENNSKMPVIENDNHVRLTVRDKIDKLERNTFGNVECDRHRAQINETVPNEVEKFDDSTSIRSFENDRKFPVASDMMKQRRKNMDKRRILNKLIGHVGDIDSLLDDGCEGQSFEEFENKFDGRDINYRLMRPQANKPSKTFNFKLHNKASFAAANKIYIGNQKDIDALLVFSMPKSNTTQRSRHNRIDGELKVGQTNKNHVFYTLVEGL
ncbi:Uncharacterised protein g3670 [Pycnogonum litorale]